MRDPFDLILWVDLETTGTDVQTDDVLEVGMIVTDQELRVISEFHRVTRLMRRELLMDGVVRRMHERSGLMEEVLNARQYSDQLEPEILDWFRTMGKDLQFALAGSGVSHFDRKFIARDWPRVNKRLRYWAYDVGVVRRFLRDICGIYIPDVEATKPHRAMADIAMHLQEMIEYRALITEAVTPPRATGTDEG